MVHAHQRNAARVILIAALTVAGSGCRESRSRIASEYDKKSGKLQLLKYDSNGDGKPDMFSYMDGSRVVRVEIDKDGDGRIDRWEYYDADQKIEKIGFSRANDGKEDAWSYIGPDGTVARIELSGRRDGKVSRIEHFEHDQMVSAEEDTDNDGRMDKWETYVDRRLASVAYDTGHRGTADRRLVYGADGSARIQVDPAGNGRWESAPPEPASPAKPR